MRIRSLFQRYADRHLVLEFSGRTVRDGNGREVGRIEAVSLHHGLLTVAGQSGADLVTLELGGQRRAAPPETQAGLRRFRLDLPFLPGTPVVTFGSGPGRIAVALARIPALRLRLARAALWPRFGVAGLLALPDAARWFSRRDPVARDRIKRRLDLGPPFAEPPLDPALLEPASAPAVPSGGVTIVLPVYEAFELLPEVLDRIRHHTDLPWRLIVIEDRSPTPAIRPFLRDWAAAAERDCPGQVQLVENDRNLGFIGSVNRGLALAAAEDDPVVLLNSDAFVPPGWASRLLAPLAEPDVASVTPMSNDAELMSVPAICAGTDLRPGEGDRIDAAARHLPSGAEPALPTGVGFCMALSPRFLREIPQFDPAFGRGYGEEVDWCRKVIGRGGRHVARAALFIEHRGGASFGSAEKARLLARNGALVTRRHPGFDAEVQRFLAEDPLVTARLALGLAWAAVRADGARVPVYLAHSIGGGAEHYLARRIGEDLARTGAALVLRVGGTERWGIELHTPSGVTRARTGDRALLSRLLSLLPARHVVYSCAVGDPDPVELPDFLIELGAGEAHRIEVLFHDYLPISPSYALLDEGGAYRGLPCPETAGPAHVLRRPNGSRTDLGAWQAAWGRLLAAADEAVVFSRASWGLVARAYPQAARKLVLRPHAPLTVLPRLPLPSGGRGRPVIGVLGNIGPQKGAGVLAALSRRFARTREADLVLIGNLDPAYRLARGARVHGSYAHADIPDLARLYGVGCWLIPSVWPETFSYATREALATGLPVVCFDLGAQAEAVCAALADGAPGAVVPLRGGKADIVALAARLLRVLEDSVEGSSHG